jgi:hypothetical protein
VRDRRRAAPRVSRRGRLHTLAAARSARRLDRSARVTLVRIPVATATMSMSMSLRPSLRDRVVGCLPGSTTADALGADRRHLRG